MNTRHFPFWPKKRPRMLPPVETNLADNLRVTAQRFPDQPAIVYYDSPITYARLWSEVEALAGWLQQRAGVKAHINNGAAYGNNNATWLLSGG